jgi:putative endonuclease
VSKGGTGKSPRSALGERGEALAVEVLKAKGYRIIERNFRGSVGEIDIVAREAQTLVFVEVKTRETDRFGTAKWAVDRKKMRKVSMAALEYLNRKSWGDRPARFDVVAVDFSPAGPQVELYRNAFDLAY